MTRRNPAARRRSRGTGALPPAPKKPRRRLAAFGRRGALDRLLIGYARVSTLDQNLALQRHALKEAGCAKLFVEQVSGAVLDRPALREALEFARAATLSLCGSSTGSRVP